MHGYGTCATIVLVYSYSMNFIFHQLYSVLKREKKIERKKKKNLAAKQACAYLIFLINVFFSIVLKYVQLN